MALFGSGNNQQRPSVQYEQKRSTPRQNQRYQNEREFNEQRVKARNRLVGAVILVIAVIILAPLLINTGSDSDTQDSGASAPLIAPSTTIGQGSLVIETTPGDSATTESESDELSAEDDAGLSIAETGVLPGYENEETDADEVTDTIESPDDGLSIAEATSGQSAEELAAAREREAREAEAAERRRQEQARAEAARAERQQQQQAAQQRRQAEPVRRTDDGSQALAILEGRSPSAASQAPRAAAPAASTSGNFSLQVASYSSANDARNQRDRLRSSGVSNAYVQSATVDGKQVFRLRVGPFSTREAAQAAQTRLRALNFSDSFITGR